MLIEIHMLQNHSASNLNRDDTGSPKECLFGGTPRARISSQCLKRTIRRSEQFRVAAGEQATRTRKMPELVKAQLLAMSEKDPEGGLSEEMINAIAKKATGFGNKTGTEDSEDKLETSQTIFLTEADVKSVAAVLYDAAKKAKSLAAVEKLKAADLQKEASQGEFRPITVDMAMFGRMVTSEAFRNIEASVQVAHALSTHTIRHEFDYFTAVDDLQGTGNESGDDPGADMIGEIEFNSACYYKYFAIDLNGLVDNLTGTSTFRRVPSDEEREEAREAAAASIVGLLRGAIFSTPSGKQNTFAAHQLPEFILVEIRPTRTPVSYANAFLEPVRANEDSNILVASAQKLAIHAEKLTKTFGLESVKRLLLTTTDVNMSGVEPVEDIAALTSVLGEALRV